MSSVLASRHAAGRVYATFDGHYNDDYRAYAYVSDDYVLYLPVWEKSQTIDLNDFNSNTVKTINVRNEAGNLFGYPEEKIRLRGGIGKAGRDEGWSRYWYASIRSNGFGNSNVDDLNDEIKKSFVMMSLFQRLPPMRQTSRLEPLAFSISQTERPARRIRRQRKQPVRCYLIASVDFRHRGL